LGRERVLERKRPNLLRQVDGEAMRLRPERFAAALEDRRLLAAVARPASTLLPVHLGGRGINLGAILDVSRAAPPLGELVANHASKNVRPRLESEYVVGELDCACLLGIESGNVGLHHSWLLPPGCSGAAVSVCSCVAFLACFGASPDALRKAPGLGALSGNARFTASWIVTQPPLAPGTAPRIMISPRSGSVFTTRRFCVVTFTSPMWPAIFLPLNTLPGA